MEGDSLEVPLLYKIVRPIVKVLVITIFRPKYIGLDNIPESGPVVIAGNHTNILDCVLLLSSTKRCIRFLAKDSLYKWPTSIIFKNLGIIPVNRSIHDKNALKKAKEFLNKGALIGIFPEGTINRTNDIIMPFKIGAVKMASDTDSLIVPFTITGKYRPFKNDLTIKFQEPYKIEGTDLDKENDKLMNKIADELKRCKK